MTTDPAGKLGNKFSSIYALVAVTGAVFAAVQVVTTSVQKSREDSLLDKQKDKELALIDRQKERELAILKEQKDKELAILESQKARELDRLEREGGQSFNLRIYDEVISSLEKKDAKRQELAHALVITLANEPFRTKLLETLGTSANSTVSVRAEAQRVIKQEAQFNEQNQPALGPLRDEGSTTDSWHYDVFWCEASGPSAQRQAEEIAGALRLPGSPKTNVRVRELPRTVNLRSGYKVVGYQIRLNPAKQKQAEILKRLAEEALHNREQFQFVSSPLTTGPFYLSLFVCPQMSGALAY